MTKAAKAFGKYLGNFFRSPETLEYIEALSLSVKSTDKGLVIVQRGNGLLPNVGTWGHPKLAVFFGGERANTGDYRDKEPPPIEKTEASPSAYGG